MKNLNSKKGFTLIELLIVIAIIAVLAVAFLPTLLNAPAKGRDTSRIASLQKIQKIVVSANLDGKAYPATGCVTTGFGAADSAYFLTSFGGTLPADPQPSNKVVVFNGTGGGCTGSYQYIKAPTANYSFGVYAKMETAAGNTTCTALAAAADAINNAATSTDSCYAVLTQ